jgi:glycine C-acetyltransferase
MMYSEKPTWSITGKLLKEGISVIGFAHPVVPKDQARIRVQVSAAHKTSDLDKAVEAFRKVGKALGIIRK